MWVRVLAYLQILSAVHAELDGKLLIPAARLTFLCCRVNSVSLPLKTFIQVFQHIETPDHHMEITAWRDSQERGIMRARMELHDRDSPNQ